MIWMTKDWTQGESNALVKKLGGDKVARGILNDTVKFTVVEMEAPPLPPALIPLALGVSISAVGECKVSDLFRGKHIAFRDEDLDGWLAETVPATEAGNTKSFKLGKMMTFAEMVEERLGMAGDTIPELQAEMVRREMYFSPKQAEDIIAACRGENPLGLLIDSRANLIPIWDGASLFFLRMGRNPLGWYVFVDRLVDSFRWDAGFVVFFRN